MSIVAKFSLGQSTITLKDLAKPTLDKREERAIKNALKKAKQDQDAMRRRASKVTSN